MAISEERVLEQSLDRAPFAAPAEARCALRATMAALRCGLLDDEAQQLAEEIGAAWAEPLRAGCYQGELPLEELYRLVAVQEQQRLSIAAEHAQLVCRIVGSELSPTARQRLQRTLPRLAAIFEQAPPADATLPVEHLRSSPAPEHTLAAGRPGSSRPLSEARPTSSRPLSEDKPDTAHTHSVARSDDPHGDTKLSSAHGLTQEREGESLGRSQRSVRR